MTPISRAPGPPATAQDIPLVPGHGEAIPAASGAIHAAVVAAAVDCIVTVDAYGLIREWNPAAAQTFGYSPDQAIGSPLAELVVPDRHRPAHLAGFEGLVARGDGPVLGTRLEVEAMRSDGSEFPCELTLARIAVDPLLFTAFARDVSLQRIRDDQLAALANENEAILSSAGDGIMRLDREGRIAYANPAAGDLLGTDPDRLIGAVAAELIHHTTEDGRPLAPAETPMCQALADGELRRVTSEVFWRADGGSFPVDYTMSPLRAETGTTGAVCVFADITEERRRMTELRERLVWQGRINRAIEEERLVAFSQPIVCLESGEPVLEEMLVRIRDRDDGSMIPAGEFVPTAERLGVIGEIDEWMVGRALELVSRGRRVTLNLSAATIGDEGLMSSIIDRIRAATPPPGSLVVELTETAVIEDIGQVRRLIGRLTDCGCPLAIDDFGTGFGSITYLRELEAHFIKIDMEFIREMDTKSSSRKIVEGIVRMAHSLGQRTVAEGIESPETLATCRELGVDFGQGYLFGRPAPLD